MNRRFIGSLILGSVCGFAAVIARAQQATPPPPPGAMLHPSGAEGDVAPPFGERMEVLGFGGMHERKVVTGAPLSAVAVTETTQTLADGNHITRKTQTNFYRDSQGRVRREVTLAGFGSAAPCGQPKSFVVIHNPVAGTNFMLHPDQKTAEQLRKPFGGRNEAKAGAVKERRAAREQQEIANGTLKKEDLGTQTINGVAAQGTRFTKTIPAGQIGNEKPITIARESWYSNELQMVVMSKHSDPWSGETTYRLTNIKRAEPEAALFTVPSDYQLTQAAPRGQGGRRHSHATPPPADN